MGRHVRKLSQNWWWGCAVGVWLIALVSVRAGGVVAAESGDNSPTVQNPSQAAAPAAQAASGGKATYVGDENCLGCHSEQRSGYERTPHHAAADPRSPKAQQGCETCHGPGSLHSEDSENVDVLQNFKKMAAADINGVCTTCHNRGEHALWDGSQHERRDLSCVNCHKLHEPVSETGSLLKETETQVCAQCHRDKAAKLDRSGHMPLREGKMSCSSCHNMHGSTNVRLLRKGDSIAEACTSCHAEKRGPYVWEHAPSRDGCVTCHDPHGSSNERMLVVKTPMLCQRCHVASRHPSTIYDQALINTSVRVYARSCVTCHTNVHGSNHPAGKFFIR
jgi:DmsE family decaheme c-type cytochrome